MTARRTTNSRETATKLAQGKAINWMELAELEECDMPLDQQPRAWRGKIKSVADLKSRIKYSTGPDKSRWLTIDLRYEYDIESRRINTEKKLLWWIDHLACKNWMTRQAICYLIEVVAKENGWTRRAL
jgi:hypothetical protein